MCIKDYRYDNLVERIEMVFCEIDSEICVDLREHNSEYIEMWQEVKKLQKEFPVIAKITENSTDDIISSLSVEECRALARCLELNMKMEDIERMEIYFRGHADCFAYLKKIGLVT